MLTLYLVRHGECVLNTQFLYCGRTDSELTPRGMEQAARAARFFRDIPLEFIYTSPLQRARTTAERIAQGRKLPVFCVPLLQEIDFGIFEGLNWQEIQIRYPEEWLAWQQDWKHFVIPRGESYQHVRQRAERFLSELKQRHPEGMGVVVSHHGLLKALLCLLLQWEDGFWRFRLEHGQVAKVEWSKEAAILCGLNICGI